MRESFAHWYNEDTRPGVGTQLRDCVVPYDCDESCAGAHTIESDGDPFTQPSLFKFRPLLFKP